MSEPTDLVRALHSVAYFRRSMEHILPAEALARALAFHAGHALREDDQKCPALVGAIHMALLGAFVTDEQGELRPGADEVERLLWDGKVIEVELHLRRAPDQGALSIVLLPSADRLLAMKSGPWPCKTEVMA